MKLLKRLFSIFTFEVLTHIIVVYFIIAIITSIDYSKWIWQLSIAIFLVVVMALIDYEGDEDE